MQERRNSIANALELYLSCTNPSICELELNLLMLYTDGKLGPISNEILWNFSLKHILATLPIGIVWAPKFIYLWAVTISFQKCLVNRHRFFYTPLNQYIHESIFCAIKWVDSLLCHETKGLGYYNHAQYITSGLILGLRPANERHHYKVALSLIGWVQTWNQSCNIIWFVLLITNFCFLHVLICVLYSYHYMVVVV